MRSGVHGRRSTSLQISRKPVWLSNKDQVIMRYSGILMCFELSFAFAYLEAPILASLMAQVEGSILRNYTG